MKFVGVAVSAVVALMVASGCGTPPASSTPSATAAAGTLSQFQPRWMTLVPPPSWTESERRITREFQQFGLRPAGENESPRGCNGCGVSPPTAFLTAYAPGSFDPAELRTGETVSISADSDGYFRPARDSADAVLVWQYADNAWATVRGRTTMTSDRDRLVGLARALRPTQFTDIQVPLSIPEVPASMPLAQISVDRGAYGTTLDFAKCGATDVGGTPDCAVERPHLHAQIWPADGYSGLIDERNSVPARIGGRDGIFTVDRNAAAVQVQPGTVVVVELSPPAGSAPNLETILSTLTWAPDPGNEQSWAKVADWVTVS